MSYSRLQPLLFVSLILATFSGVSRSFAQSVDGGVEVAKPSSDPGVVTDAGDASGEPDLTPWVDPSIEKTIAVRDEFEKGSIPQFEDLALGKVLTCTTYMVNQMDVTLGSAPLRFSATEAGSLNLAGIRGVKALFYTRDKGLFGPGPVKPDHTLSDYDVFVRKVSSRKISVEVLGWGRALLNWIPADAIIPVSINDHEKAVIAYFACELPDEASLP